ncbi:hypothetical protein [Bizionia paragorgiae]|uniref:SH3 domain-containing protein n=1 Tax=Bizionia paragorgiae TaxID=283786 RepID=A0A1H3ZVN7_BIZPA|nr:hypothetical protein [Bizionia paragorgiae]SEA27344.1 hypothetical protein SAMN04487990_10975 [Bizionia paragorgiae]
MKKLVAFTFLFLALFSGYAQHNLNNYKYVIVPDRYEFLNTPNEFRLNELTKFLFEKYNFLTYMESDILPEDVKSNRCLALSAKVIDRSSMFKTSLIIVLENCKKDIEFSSHEGTSRDKLRDVAFNKALRAASQSLAALNYSYRPDENQIKLVSESTKIKEEIKALKQEITSLKDAKEVTESRSNESSNTVKRTKDTVTLTTPLKETVFKATKTSRGYEVSNSVTNEVVLLFPTDLKDVFMVKDKNAILYKKDGVWIYASLNNSEMVSKVMDIQF